MVKVIMGEYVSIALVIKGGSHCYLTCCGCVGGVVRLEGRRLARLGL